MARSEEGSKVDWLQLQPKYVEFEAIREAAAPRSVYRSDGCLKSVPSERAQVSRMSAWQPFTGPWVSATRHVLVAFVDCIISQSERLSVRQITCVKIFGASRGEA